MKRIRATTIVLLLAASQANGSDAIVLIRGGQGHATIVVPVRADALAKRTATDLQQVLGRMTGVSLPVRADDGEVTGNRVLVGNTRWTDAVVPPAERAGLKPEAFVLRRRGRDIALAGGGPYGVAYAGSELLERLGARWYVPGPLGEVIPKLDEVRFDRLDVQQSPSFPMRWVGTDTDWNLRNRTNRIGDASLPPAYRIESGIYHTQARLIPHKVYYDRHPEYFALVDGERSRDESCKLCNSNAELPAEIARRMGEMLRSEAGVDLISLSPTDGQRWCECDGCKALDEKDVSSDQKYSRRQMVLYNRVATELEKSFPDQLMLVGAYNVYTWPPRDPQIKGHRNLAVVICHYEDYCLAHPVNDPQCKRNRRYVELIEAWQKHTPHVFFYEYYYKVNWFDLPWPIVHTVAADIPHFKEIGVEGLYTQYTLGSIWSNFLVHYVAARLLWDHTADVPAMLEEFYPKFYGRAAGAMKAYHEALERQVAQSTRHFPGHAPGNATRIFTPELLRQLEGHLDEARALATDQAVRARIERITLSIAYTQRMVRVLRLREEARTATGPTQIKLRREALDRAISLRKDVLGNKARYAGVADGRYFRKRKMFGRVIDKLERQLRDKEAAPPARRD